MSELLTAPERNGMLLIASEGDAAPASPPREENGAPSGHWSEMSEPSLRPNEMSELLTAPERNGMLLIPSEEMPQPLTASEGEGMRLRALE
jgi:hypothetical protein